MFVEFKFDILCGVGTVTIKPILRYYTELNFHAGKLGELNDCVADDLITWAMVW